MSFVINHHLVSGGSIPLNVTVLVLLVVNISPQFDGTFLNLCIDICKKVSYSAITT
jgi:hypothetical protein